MNSGLWEPIIIGWNLRIVFIACLRATHRQVNEFRNMCDLSGGRIMVSGLPQSKMPQYLFDDVFILDKADNFHYTLALRAQ
jgi:hypothetical protein